MMKKSDSLVFECAAERGKSLSLLVWTWKTVVGAHPHFPRPEYGVSTSTKDGDGAAEIRPSGHDDKTLSAWRAPDFELPCCPGIGQ
ncbi:hypothetical protein [Streptomyces sp. NPDC048442]|uniref:hypothetical protein n=1 Tax=Streptomyces sp. NPDC048442 TaxID=3154823 RepID=UPI003423201E